MHKPHSLCELSERAPHLRIKTVKTFYWKDCKRKGEEHSGSLWANWLGMSWFSYERSKSPLRVGVRRGKPEKTGLQWFNSRSNNSQAEGGEEQAQVNHLQIEQLWILGNSCEQSLFLPRLINYNWTWENMPITGCSSQITWSKTELQEPNMNKMHFQS